MPPAPTIADIARLAGVGTAIGSGILAASVGAQNMSDLPMGEILSSRLSIALVGLLSVTLGPLWEELTFRGFLLPLLAKSLGATAAILITGNDRRETPRTGRWRRSWWGTRPFRPWCR